MSGRWGDGPPPEEAYSRLTDPQRFAPLHDAARTLLDDLAARPGVVRTSGSATDPLPGAPPAAVVTLTPPAPAVALEIVFTAFPGLLVRIGGLDVLRLPCCGCDACDEDAPELLDELHVRVDALVAGASGERLVRHRHRFPGAGYQGDAAGPVIDDRDGWFHETWYPGGSSGTGVEGAALDAVRARLRDGERNWDRWPPPRA